MEESTIKRVVDALNYRIIESISQRGKSDNGGSDKWGFYPRFEFGYVTDIGYFVKYLDNVVWDEENDGDLSESELRDLLETAAFEMNELVSDIDLIV